MELTLNLRINDQEVGGAIYQIPRESIIGSTVRALDDFSRRTTRLLLESFGTPFDLERYGRTPLFQTTQGYDLYTRDLKRENADLRRRNADLEQTLRDVKRKSMQMFLNRSPNSLIKELKSLRRKVAKLSKYKYSAGIDPLPRKYYRVYFKGWFGGARKVGVAYGIDQEDAVNRFLTYHTDLHFLDLFLEEFIPKKYVK